ncbi:Putative U3 small nucleolar RNA-associated protein [Septoria linicola]|uniref:U3 small nucleolar RNA-associated protein n=1 Tax=Septoria linicola TaxID=215465 RepID=A0A9Q9EQJ5_9PEZI|nr:putative U3 small nucleolar RNA-associated protein [Septoria linicola]USW59190.1 Putative U3 small nucleolar RNA-associated protein [Septoria linicola]
MAAASDKARFYLEQYVPELREYEAKEIFTRDQITAITKKRSDFEHTLNARGSTATDYARYAQHEINLSALLKKRCKRLGIQKTATTNFNGQRTVFFILDRAVKKFPGDVGLWMQYVDFCKKEKANKKLAKVLTRMLRLHTRNWKLWVVAAKHYAEVQGDMGTARSYFQRGLRFCKEEKRLWIEYVRLELVYLAKLAARKKILGLDEDSQMTDVREEEGLGGDDDEVKLPTVTAADLEDDADDKGVEEVNEGLLKRLKDAPAFTGGIPMAIFDAAMKQFIGKAAELAEEFYDLVASLEQVPAIKNVRDHILDWLRAEASTSAYRIICEAKNELHSLDSRNAQFPAALTRALGHIKEGKRKLMDDGRPNMAEKTCLLLLPYLQHAGQMDRGVVRVLESSIKRNLKLSADGSSAAARQHPTAVIVSKLQYEGALQDIQTLERLVSEIRDDYVGQSKD